VHTAALAQTGSDLGGLWGAIALLLIAGLGLLLGSRRLALQS
jgi:LPXTG-motif cell wall-anchored protein